MTFVHNLAPVLESKRAEITAWMSQKRSEVPIPIYGSVDIRDAGWKISVVDANHFPAGFNNVSTEDKPSIGALLKTHILREYHDCEWVHLYPESHTRNKGYVENLIALKELLEIAGFRCTVGSVDFVELGHLIGLSGALKLDQVESKSKDGEDILLIDGQRPDLILLNNDLTEGIVAGLGSQIVSPPPSMGWHRRRKSQHYEVLREYVEEIAQMLDIDPWHFMADWFVSKNKCLEKEACRIELAAEVDTFLENLRQKYLELGVDREPVVFIKNDRGTYGLGIMTVRSGSELLQLSNRKMNRLMYSKGLIKNN